MFNSISLCNWSIKTIINFLKLAEGDENKVEKIKKLKRKFQFNS